MTDPARLVTTWPARTAAGWAGPRDAGEAGPADEIFPWASVTKVVTSMAVWLAAEEEIVSWSDPVGPRGATLAHLLSHASGLAADSDQVLAAPGRRRIYSNRGIELAAEHVGSQAAMPFADYVTEGVLGPLGLEGVRWRGSPAHGAAGPVTDLLTLGRELLEPTILSRTSVEAATSVAFPGLNGVLPGFGRQEPNDWGLGVEVRDHKSPHWTGHRNSAETFGHFGQSGAFLWVDPVHRTIAAAAGDQPFGPWAIAAWPLFADAVIAQVAE